MNITELLTALRSPDGLLRCRVLRSASLLICLILPSIASAAPGYITEERSLASPIPDATGINKFGVAVAISDGLALVGASEESSSGGAHLYDSNTGVLLHTLSPENKNVWNFGRTVALAGKYAVVGSQQANYVYDTKSYDLLYTLPASYDIDIDDGRLLVGGFAVYDLASGQRLALLGKTYTSAALSGDLAIVGDIGANSNLIPGSARVFNWRTGQQLYDLTPTSMPNGALFGVSVAIEGNIAVVGIPQGPKYGGSAYVFDLTTGNLIHQLEEAERAIRSGPSSFGYDVAIHGDTAIVGAFRQTGFLPVGSTGRMDRITELGAAYAFSVETGEEIARFTTSHPIRGGLPNYGFSIDYDGRQLIAGTLGWPKRAYITGFAIPEPSVLTLLSALAISLSLLSRRRVR